LRFLEASGLGETNRLAPACDPYYPQVGLYDSVSRQYEKSWEVVHKAQKSKKDSGRNN
jgi:hypothetical protein